MAAPTWARARARARVRARMGTVEQHPACVRACARSGRRCVFLGIPIKRSAFCRKRRFLKSAVHIYRYTCNCSVDITLKKNKDIGDLLSAEYVQQKAKNRSYLSKVLQTYLACQSLPMRGNWASVEED